MTNFYKYALDTSQYILENCKIPIDSIHILDEGKRLVIKYKHGNIMLLGKELDIFKALESKIDYAKIMCEQIELEFKDTSEIVEDNAPKRTCSNCVYCRQESEKFLFCTLRREYFDKLNMVCEGHNFEYEYGRKLTFGGK